MHAPRHGRKADREALAARAAAHEELEAQADGGADRFVSTYCLDLMSEKDMLATLDKARANTLDDASRILTMAIV